MLTLILPFAILLLFTSLTHAHVRLKSPTPYGPNDWTFAKNLHADQFPCRHLYDNTTPTVMTVGEVQPLRFMEEDTATHGGGSCQISISRNMNPTSSANFKVIKSFIGECPARYHPDWIATVRNDMNFTIPPITKSGLNMAVWTWSPCKTQEFFMACAPITIVGGKEEWDTAEFDALPNIVVANLEGTACAHDTAANNIPVYPQKNMGGGGDIEWGFDESEIQTLGVKLLPLPDVCTEVFVGSSATGLPSSAFSTTAGMSTMGSSGTVISQPPTSTLSSTPAGTQAPQTQTTALSIGSVSGCPGEEGKVKCREGDGRKFWGQCSNEQVTWQEVPAGSVCVDGFGVEAGPRLI